MSRIKDALEKARRMRETSMPIAVVSKDDEIAENSHFQETPKTKLVNYSIDAVKKYKIVNLYEEEHILIERFKLLRTKILSNTQSHGDRTLLITSCIDGEGKTFNAVNLAITFAREVDQTVLLVDANLRNPSLLKAFGIKAKEGLTDYLIHDKPLSELLIRPGIEKLTILPAGSHVRNSAELLRSLKMQRLIAEMKNRYDNRYIFFDAPSVLTSVDTLVLSKYVDRVLLVIETGKVSPEKMSEAINLLGEEKILGTVFNKGSSLAEKTKEAD